MMAESSAGSVAYLKEEVHNLKDENALLYAQLQRMEKNWDALLKKVENGEACRKKGEKDIYKLRHELQDKLLLGAKMCEENSELKTIVEAVRKQNQELNDQLQQQQEAVKSLEEEATATTEKYKQGAKTWKEEKRVLVKQKEDGRKKLESCEEELQIYINDNAKLERQFKQVSLHCFPLLSLPHHVLYLQFRASLGVYPFFFLFNTQIPNFVTFLFVFL